MCYLCRRFSTLNPREDALPVDDALVREVWRAVKPTIRGMAVSPDQRAWRDPVTNGLLEGARLLVFQDALKARPVSCRPGRTAWQPQSANAIFWGPLAKSQRNEHPQRADVAAPSQSRWENSGADRSKASRAPPHPLSLFGGHQSAVPGTLLCSVSCGSHGSRRCTPPEQWHAAIFFAGFLSLSSLTPARL